MGERASIRMKAGPTETKECLYLHWGGNHVGEFLLEAEAIANSTNPDDCLTALETAMNNAGYTPEREVIEEIWSDGSNAGNFLVDVSQPNWAVEIESEYGYGLRGESKYHFKHAEFRVPNDPNGRPENDGRTDNHGHHHLMNAVSENDVRMVEGLLEAGADPNQYDQGSKRYALHQCVYTDNTEVATLLLNHGARLDVVDDRGRTPKDYAENTDVLEVIEHHEAYLESQRRNQALGEVVQASRSPSDLASPDEYMARKSRGRAM